MEGSLPNINDPIRGEGTFNKAMEGIKHLIKNHVYSIVSMVVQESNFDDMENFYQLVRSLGVDEIRYIPLKLMGRASSTIHPISKKALFLRIQDLMNKYEDARKYLKRDFHTIIKETYTHSYKTRYCGTGLKTGLIDADGEIYPCPNHCLPEFSCGNINQKSFKEIWLNSPILQKLRSIYDVNTINEDCTRCVLKYWCAGGCRGEPYENTYDMTSKAIDCKDLQDTIIETFWILASEPHRKYPKKKEHF